MRQTSGRSAGDEKREGKGGRPVTATGTDWSGLEPRQVWRPCADETERGRSRDSFDHPQV